MCFNILVFVFQKQVIIKMGFQESTTQIPKKNDYTMQQDGLMFMVLHVLHFF